jgi:hypothetical protein
VHLTCLVQPRDDARLAADVESAERVLGSNAATFDRGDAYYARVLCSMIHPRTGQITASDEVLLANNDIVAYLRCALTLRASVSPTTTATSTSTMTPMTRRTLFRALLQRPAVVAAINSLSQGDLAALFYAVDDTRDTGEAALLLSHCSRFSDDVALLDGIIFDALLRNAKSTVCRVEVVAAILKHYFHNFHSSGSGSALPMRAPLLASIGRHKRVDALLHLARGTVDEIHCKDDDDADWLVVLAQIATTFDTIPVFSLDAMLRALVEKAKPAERASIREKVNAFVRARGNERCIATL